MYNKKITPYDNKEIIIGGCHKCTCLEAYRLHTRDW